MNFSKIKFVISQHTITNTVPFVLKFPVRTYTFDYVIDTVLNLK